MNEQELGDRQLDALLERLDRLNAELRALNRRLDSGEHLAPIVHELGALNDSLQALAYAALGQQGPQVRRRAPASSPREPVDVPALHRGEVELAAGVLAERREPATVNGSSRDLGPASRRPRSGRGSRSCRRRSSGRAAAHRLAAIDEPADHRAVRRVR